MTRTIPVVGLLVLVLGACRGSDARREVPTLTGRLSIPAEVAAAEAAIRDGRAADAEALLAKAGGIAASAPERSWLLIDLLRSRCAAAQAKAAADALPDARISLVLRAHARRDPEERLRLVRPVFGRASDGWAQLEAASALEEEGGEHEAVSRHVAAAVLSGPDYVRREAVLVAGRDALDDRRPSEALAFAGRAARFDPTDPRPRTLSSQALFRMGKIADATREALAALILQPKGLRTARRVADDVREDPGAAVEAEVRRAVASLLCAAPANGELQALYALLLDRAGDRTAAIAGYRQAILKGANPIPVERRLRRLLFSTGHRQEAMALLRRAVPPEVVADPRNLLRGAWQALDRAAASAPDGPAPPPALEGLAAALVGVGAVEDALRVLESAPSLTAQGAAAKARFAAEIAFERAVREAVEEGYRAKAQKKDVPDLNALLARVQAIARERLPADEAREFQQMSAGRRNFPLLGEWLDHATDTTSPVVLHFRRLGKYMMIGQRSGSPPEAILLSLASLTRKQEIRTQGKRFQHDVAIGYDREIRAYVDFQGGALSGACLPDGLWFDADAARKEEHDLRAGTRVDAALAARLDRAAREAPAVDGMEGPFAMDDPEGLYLRLVRRYVARAGADPWGSFDVLRAHESGHVLDIRRHLPVLQGLPATLGLVLSEGFSFDRIEARLEGRAQRAALMDAKDPDLALAEMVRSLPLFEKTPEAHEWGYRDQVVAMIRFIEANAKQFPAIDVSRKILPQLDRLSLEELRKIARSLAGVEDPLTSPH